MDRHRAEKTMTTKLAHFTQKARAEPRELFNSLMGLLFDPAGLHASFRRQAQSKAPGVEGMRKGDYAEGLEDRIEDLSGRLRRLGYRPQPSRRTSGLRSATSGAVEAKHTWCDTPTTSLHASRMRQMLKDLSKP